ncbi:hypothetical protein GCM10009668_17960 [Nocardioides dubius]|uniref:Uncharacterized protein n=1 Tax=Nocardioides dubius TaxID=317019 RepID=A0ABP4EDJ1_9ACTN
MTNVLSTLGETAPVVSEAVNELSAPIAPVEPVRVAVQVTGVTAAAAGALVVAVLNAVVPSAATVSASPERNAAPRREVMWVPSPECFGPPPPEALRPSG